MWSPPYSLKSILGNLQQIGWSNDLTTPLSKVNLSYRTKKWEVEGLALNGPGQVEGIVAEFRGSALTPRDKLFSRYLDVGMEVRLFLDWARDRFRPLWLLVYDKKTAYLINTARGPVVDEKALTVALEKGEIAGAALDVFEYEPAIDCDLTDTHELKKLDNVVLTPHTASAAIEARSEMAEMAAQNVIAALKGKKPKNLVK